MTERQKRGVSDALDVIMPPMPEGPLDRYRKTADFDYQTMKMFLDGEDDIRAKHIVYETLKYDPLFDRPLLTPSLSEQRDLNYRRWRRVVEYKFSDPSDMSDAGHVLAECLMLYDEALAAKHDLSARVFRATVALMGSDRHQPIVDALDEHRCFGCFALTEISHGSNGKAMNTTATYEVKAQRYILNTPSMEAAKIWIGNLGQMATHVTVFAQLHIAHADGRVERRGLHCFVVQIRSTTDLRPLPGVIVGDMGEKCGWNGLDNGWLMFNKYPADHSILLNRAADVEKSTGEYRRRGRNGTSSSSSSSSSSGADNFGPLSMGRVGIVAKGGIATRLAATIAVRYSGVRRQFGPPDSDEEWPVLEYPLHQARILPILSASYVLTRFANVIHGWFIEFTMRMMSNDPDTAGYGREIHGVSSACKPVATWMGVKSLQEAREACGGHGFLKAWNYLASSRKMGSNPEYPSLQSTRLGDLRNDYDPSQTYEGENNMIVLQAANYLLGLYHQFRKTGAPIRSPFGTVDFIGEEMTSNNRRAKETGDLATDCLDAYAWLGGYLLRRTANRIATKITHDQLTPFVARNQSQLFNAHSLAVVYGERTIIAAFADYISESSVPSVLRPVLRQMLTIYACTHLYKHLPLLYMGGYCVGEAFGSRIQEGIQSNCALLKKNAVTLVDAIAPPDHVLSSTLGASDGQAYQRLFASMIQSSEGLERPAFWSDFVEFMNPPSAKL